VLGVLVALPGADLLAEGLRDADAGRVRRLREIGELRRGRAGSQDESGSERRAALAPARSLRDGD
jgi:hypothetical protein